MRSEVRLSLVLFPMSCMALARSCRATSCYALLLINAAVFPSCTFVEFAPVFRATPLQDMLAHCNAQGRL